MSDGGKGSVARPFSVDQKTFADNWDAIFGKKKKQQEEKPEEENTNNEVPEEKDSQENK